MIYNWPQNRRRRTDNEESDGLDKSAKRPWQNLETRKTQNPRSRCYICQKEFRMSISFFDKSRIWSYLLVINVFTVKADKFYPLFVCVLNISGKETNIKFKFPFISHPQFIASVYGKEARPSRHVMWSPCGSPLAQKLHDSPLHTEPEHSGKIEEEGHEDEVEGHPLVVGIVHDWAPGVHVPGVHGAAGAPELPGDPQAGVHPAVALQHAQLYPLASLK